MPKFAYALYIKNDYPHCPCEPTEDLNGIWLSLSQLKKELKSKRIEFSIYNEDNIIIRKFKPNTFYSL